ncbi:MAG: phosphatase [Vallitaleaceae bacterium]|nr:phosphatase [Vallitaleaceae bacterium]
MKFLLDVHTHTIASGHAYSTFQENVAAAKEKGLQIYGVSEHGPAMPDAPYLFHFQNLRVLPRRMEGILILRGAEANIIDVDGTIDMQPSTIESLDYLLASMHLPCINSMSREENTLAMINTMAHPLVKIIGHPDDSRYPLDYDRLAKAAGEAGVALEVNNSSLSPTSFRANAKENVTEMLRACMKYGTYVVANSDAHISYDVGNFKNTFALFEAANFDPELILNTNTERFLRFIGYKEDL